jgi:hypothetical protein
MAYKKYTKRATKRRTTRRKAGRKTRSNGSRKLRKYTDVLIPEIKHYDNATTIAAPMTPTQTMQVMTGIGFYPVQGTDFTNRIGRRVKIIKMQMNCILTPALGTIANSGDIVRCDLWIDKECKGTTPTAVDVYETPTNGTASFQNASYLRRFQQLHQTYHAITPMSSSVSSVSSAAAQVASCYDIALPKGGIEVNFGTNNGNVTDILDNLVFMGMSQNGAAASCTIGVNMRYWYTDL